MGGRVGDAVGRLLGGEVSLLSPIITAPPLELLSPDARVKLPPVLVLPSAARDKLPSVLVVCESPFKVSDPPLVSDPSSRFKLPPLPVDDESPFKESDPPLMLPSSDSRFKLPPLLVDEEPPSNEAPALLPSPEPIEVALLANPEADELLPRAKSFMPCSEDEGLEVAFLLRNNGIITPICRSRWHEGVGLESSNQNSRK